MSLQSGYVANCDCWTENNLCDTEVILTRSRTMREAMEDLKRRGWTQDKERGLLCKRCTATLQRQRTRAANRELKAKEAAKAKAAAKKAAGK